MDDRSPRAVASSITASTARFLRMSPCSFTPVIHIAAQRLCRCKHCAALEPIWTSLAERLDGKVKVGKVNHEFILGD